VFNLFGCSYALSSAISLLQRLCEKNASQVVSFNGDLADLVLVLTAALFRECTVERAASLLYAPPGPDAKKEKVERLLCENETQVDLIGFLFRHRPNPCLFCVRKGCWRV
jgi:hypothetical protein